MDWPLWIILGCVAGLVVIAIARLIWPPPAHTYEWGD